jgi:hypothetical protein
MVPVTPRSSLDILAQETIMLKKISAVLLAVSMLAAPTFAASSSKLAKAPVTKVAQVNTDKKAEAPKTDVKVKKISHRKHHRHHYAQHRKAHSIKTGALKTKSKMSYKHPTKSKVSFKHAATTTKRG